MKKKSLFLIMAFVFAALSIQAQDVIKIGIIGLDTSHSPAFIKMLNSEKKQSEHQGFRVVAAYPYGSKTIESSTKKIPEYTKTAEEYGVVITESIADLLKQVDCVMLETNDGTVHLEQALEVFKAGKPMFIDKPVAANLPEAIAIFKLSEKYNVPIFSSSSLRYAPQTQFLRAGRMGKVLGADCYSPAPTEPSHDDFYWYGIHGIESLYTVMGTGCETVSRASTQGTDVVTGIWKDGRIGTFRGTRQGPWNYGGTAFCERENHAVGGYPGYEVLLTEVLKFFKTKVVPIDPQETIELYVFMTASDESKRAGGKPVSMQKVYEKGSKQADKIIKKL